MSNLSIKALTEAHVMNTYGRLPIAIVRGEGARLWDADGREYLDFFAGIAVCNLGHCHPKVTEAVCRQAATLVHVSNLYHIETQAELASRLAAHSFAGRWFFCNGGAEANEAAIKLARRYWAVAQGTPRPGVVTANHSFHGRTLCALTATGQPKYHEGFEPLVPGFTYVDYDNLDALEAALNPSVGLVLLEPVQGEGGVRVPSPGYLRGVRELCDRHNVLLALDEVQTGLGRTGRLFCHEHSGITPDIMTLAKGLGNGVPIGAMGCTERVSAGFAPGSHACTFGGNPLSAAAGVATMDALTEPGFIETAARRGDYLHAALRELASRHPGVREVRGMGLMAGVECAGAVGPLVGAMRDAGVICGPAGPNVLRFLPPLVVTEADIDTVMAALDRCLGDLGW